MHFLIRYGERPGSGEARTRLREEHIAFRKGLGGALAMAGALVSDDGAQTIGSLLLIEAEGRAQAEAIAQSDPFVAGGVLEVNDITAYRIAVTRPPAPG